MIERWAVSTTELWSSGPGFDTAHEAEMRSHAPPPTLLVSGDVQGGLGIDAEG
jgi:hypothetical protein